MKNRKLEINPVALLGSGLLIASMLTPWWGFFTNNNTESFLYPYIIKGPVVNMIGYARSPQMLLLTWALVISIILGLFGSFIQKLPGKIFRLLSGSLTVIFLWRFIYRMTEIADSFNLPLQGVGDAEYGGFFVATATSSLKPGFYLACAAAAVLILAALITWTISFGRSTLPGTAEG